MNKLKKRIELLEKRIKRIDDAPLETYYQEDAKGFYIRSNEYTGMEVGELIEISTKLYMNIPKEYELNIRRKDDLKEGIIVLNSSISINSEYTKEIKLLVYNNSSTTFNIDKGERLALCTLCKIYKANFKRVKDLINEKD